MARRLLARTVAALAILAAGTALLLQIAILFDLQSFEWQPLSELLGVRGLLTILALNVGLVLVISVSLHALRSRPHPYPKTTVTVLVAVAGLAVWILQYMFLETPLSVRFALLADPPQKSLASSPAEPDLQHLATRLNITEAQGIEKLRIMYERVRTNSPDAYARHPIGATLDKYSKRYGVDPSLLLFLNYIDSYYGEAVSGPVPFLRSMTSETIRDTIQVHLPAWFVESKTRLALIAGTGLERALGSGIGFKLRYAIHKATLDVSLQPYAINTYSDIFLVMRAFPEEFPELAADGATDGLRQALRDSYARLADNALVEPFEHPYERPAYDDAYYDAHRGDLKQFARAVFYLTLQDFDFATRVQALLSKYQASYYANRLGAERWSALPDWQRVAMLAMIRDLYQPNVGRLGYNVYALPELNCTPLEFVASQAAASPELSASLDKLWRPKDFLQLWGGATYRLRVLNEVWELTHQQQRIPGLGIEYTTDEARKVVWLAAGI